MSLRVTFKIEGQDDPVVIDDATVPVPNSQVVIDGTEYDVVSVAFAYFTADPGAQVATVRLRTVPPAPGFVPPARIR